MPEPEIHDNIKAWKTHIVKECCIGVQLWKKFETKVDNYGNDSFSCLEIDYGY